MQRGDCSHGDGQTHMTWKAEHTVWRGNQFTGKPSQVSSLFEGIKKCKTTRRSVICNSKKKKVFTVFQHSEPLSSWVHLRSEPQVAKKEGHSSWERHFTLLFLSLSRPALWVVAGRLPSGVCSTADCSSLPKDTDSRDLMQTERHYRKWGGNLGSWVALTGVRGRESRNKCFKREEEKDSKL